MMRIFIAVCLIFMIVFAPFESGAQEFKTIVHEGYTRDFIVYVPDNLKGKKNLPVVMVLHGGGGNAVGMMELTDMNKTADKHGFIVVYPEGIGSKVGDMHTWNAEGCCGLAQKKNIDDVGFIKKVISFLYQNYSIDKSRVYATGHSNGAMMSYRLACEASDYITAIAPNGGNSLVGDCEMKRPVPVLHFHGTKDNCSPYYGGDRVPNCFAKFMGVPENRLNYNKLPSVEDGVSRWAKFDGCSLEKKVTFRSGKSYCETFQGCPDGAQVSYCTLVGGGHTWPGSTTGKCTVNPNIPICKKWNKVAGQISMDIDANEKIWEFFSKYRIQ